MDNTAPAVASAEVTGTALAVTFGEDLAAADNLANGAFTVEKTPTGSATAQSVTLAGSPAIEGKTVTLTLGAAVLHTDVVTVSYAKPTSGTDNTLEDLAGNAAADFTDRAVDNKTLDTTAPAVTSIARHDPATSPTKADSLTWRVTFSEAVANVDAADFAVSGTTATVTAVAEATDAEHAWDVTVSGGGLASLDGTVTLGFAGGQDITDTATPGNDLTNLTPTGTNEPTYEVDNTAPAVASAEVTGTALAVTFGEDLAAADNLANGAFTVEKTPTGSATAQSVTLAGSPAIEGKTVTLTLGAAVLHTDVVTVSYAKPTSGTDNTLEDLAGNAAADFTDRAVDNKTLDTTAPAVTSIARHDPATSPTKADSLTWRVTFSEAVANVDAADFAVSGTAATVTAVAEATDAEHAWDVTVSGGGLASLDGTVTLGFAGGQDITDTATPGNDLTNLTPTGTNEPTYEVDNTAPAVASAEVTGTALAVTFGEDLAAADNLANGAFTVEKTPTGSATAQSVTLAGSPAIEGKTVTLTLGAAVLHTDVVTVSYAKPTSGTDNTLEDLAGNAAADFTDRAVDNKTLDTTAPAVTSIARHDPATSPTKADSLTWRVTFSEAVANVDAADFAVSGTAATVTGVAEATDAEHAWDVTVSGGGLASLDGTVTLGFAGGQDITDTATPGNDLTNLTPTGTNEPTYEVDNTAPAVASAEVTGTALAVTFGEDLAAADNLANGAFTVEKTPTGSATAQSVTLAGSPAIEGKTVTLTLGAAVLHTDVVTVSYAKPTSGTDNTLEDLAGNAAADFTDRAVDNKTLDTTAPAVTSIARHDPATSPTKADSLTWRVTFSEAVANVDAADFAVSGTAATVTGVAEATDAEHAWDVTVSGGGLASLDGTVTLGFAGGQDITDTATPGNDLTNLTPTGTNEPTYEVDNTAPAVASAEVTGTALAVTFGEDLAAADNLANGAFTVEKTPTGSATAQSVTLAGSPAIEGKTVTLTLGAAVLHTDVVTVSYAKPTSGTDNTLEDLAGNAAADFTDRAVDNKTLDTTAPAVTSIARHDPATSPTKADSLTWRVTFSEAVANVDAADFAVSGTAATVTGVAEATDAEHAWDVTVSGGGLASLDGTVTLGFAGGQDITDTATPGNDLTNLTPTGTNEPTYEVDNTAPAVASAEVTGTALAVTFGEDLAAADNLANGAFTVEKTPTGSATAQSVTLAGSPAIEGKTVTLTLGAAVLHTDVVTVSYAKPTSGTDNTLEDLAGNAAADFTDRAVDNKTLDTTAPAVTSIARHDPATSPTKADSLTWRVTFSEAVANVDAADFAVSGTAATVTAVAEATDAEHAWDVTVSGGGLASLDGTVTLGFAGGQDITDTATPGNDLTNLTPTGTNEPTYEVDNTAPAVASAEVTGTALAVTFGEDLAAADNLANGAFTVEKTPTGSATAQSVTLAGSPAIEGKTVTLTLGAAVLHTDVVTVSYAKPTSGTDNTLEDLAGNAAADFTDRAVDNKTLDTTAPTVTSIARHDPATSPTKADSLTWRVTFSEAVANVDAADFAVSGTAATVTAVAEATDAEHAWDVTVSGGGLASLDGTVTLGFAGGQDITDTATPGNDLTNLTPTGTNEPTYAVDNTAPAVASAEVTGTALAVTFGEDLAAADNLANGAFTVEKTPTGSATAQSVTLAGSPAIEGKTVTLTLGAAVLHTDVVTVSYAKPTSGTDNTLEDLAGNAAADFTDRAVDNKTLDTTAPAVTSIARHDPATSPTKADSLTWRVTFSEAVANVDAADFAVSGTAATVTGVAEATDAEHAWDVTVSGGGLASLDGTVTLGFAGGQDITDTATPGNDLTNLTPTGTNEPTYEVDNTAPAVASAEVTGTALAVTFGEDLAAADNLANGAFTVEKTPTGSATAQSVTLAGSPAIEGKTVTLTLGAAVLHTDVVTVSYAKPTSGTDNTLEDLAGNAAADFTDRAVDNKTLDTTAPTVTSIARHDPAASPTNADSLTWRVTFNKDVKNVDAADFAVSGTTATVTDVDEVTASTVYDVTVSGGGLASLDGTVTLGFAGGQDITDTATPGNDLTNLTPTGTNEPTYEVDNTAPAVASAEVTGTALAVTFGEDLAAADNLANGAFTVEKTPTGSATAQSVTLAGSPAIEGKTVTLTLGAAVLHTDVVTVSYAKPTSGTDNTLEDLAGNAAADFTDRAVDNKTLDTTAPTVTSIARHDPAASPTNADSLTWRVTFNKDVKNVDAADFAVSGTTATVTDVDEVTASTVYDVTVSGGDLASLTGTVTLGFANGQDIEDTAGTELADTTPTGTNTNENTYKLDNTARVVTGARMASSVGVDGVWRAGDELKAVVRFNKAVTVDTTGGEPTLAVMLGDGRREAVYYGGSGTRALRFHHEVGAADDGARGAWVVADGLSANGATIRSAAGVEAALGFTPPPVVTSVSVAADTDGDGLWSAGEAVIVTVDFSEAVTVRIGDGTPSVSVMAGGSREAVNSEGSGTASLRFAYTMTDADKTATSVAVPSNALTLNGGAIVGPTGLAAVLSHAKVYLFGTPTRTSSSLSVSDASASEGGALAFAVTLDPAELVTVWVDWATSDGTARAGEDYTAGSGRLIFEPGVTSNTVRVTVLVDEEVEGAETMRLALSNAAGARLPDAAATGTVSDPPAEAPPAISIADATVDEEPGAELAFAVTLDRASQAPAAVDWETRDGNARAGEDYVAGSGTLRFAPGETAKTIRVAVLDDSHDEGTEVMLVALSNPVGATIAKRAAGGIIQNTDHMPAAWLARFGRTVAEQVLDAVEERIRSAQSAGVQVTVAGQQLGAAQAPDAAALEEVEAKARLEGFSTWLHGEVCRDDAGTDGDCPAGTRSREVTGRELLTGSSFALTTGAEGVGAGLVSLWGRGAVSSFDGREGELSLSGEVSGALLGADWTREAWTAGLMLSHARGEGSYRGANSGEVTSTVTGLYPYGRYALSERVTVWGSAGFGAGTLVLTPQDGEALETDMDLAMAAAGLRGVVVEASDGGVPELAVKSDAMAVRTSSDAVASAGGNLAAATADVTRLRLGLEGTWRGLEIGTGTLEPRLEVGVRHDGGDAETGFGLDLGGGLAWSDPGTGVRAEMSARGLLTHESAGFHERGIAGSFGWDPAPGSERGPSLTLRQTLGVSASGGADALLGRTTLAGLAANDDGDELDRRRLEVKLGYGFGARGDRFTARPELGFAMSEGHREYSLVWRLVRDRRRGDIGSLEFTVEARRRESANDPGSGADAESEHGLGLRMSARW